MEPDTLRTNIKSPHTLEPGKGLVMACKKTYKEAYQFYKEASSRLWQEARFEFDVDDNGQQWDNFLAFTSPTQLDLISHLGINNSCFAFNGSRVRLILTKIDPEQHLWQLGWEDQSDGVMMGDHRDEWPVSPMYVRILIRRLRGEPPSNIGPIELDLCAARKEVMTKERSGGFGGYCIQQLGLSLAKNLM